MPQTPVYGLPFESPGDLPGHTLDGGPVGDQPILAEAVEAELSRVDGAIQDASDALAQLENKLFLLDRVNLTGEVGTGTPLVIPSDMRGEFDSYVLEVDASVGVSLQPLVVRVNGLADDNYRATATAFDTALTSQASSNLNDTSFPRTGFLGEFGSFHRIYFRPRSKGNTGFVQWVSNGWANEGGANSILVFGGGRWNGSVQTIANFTIRTNSSSDVWSGNSSATLWGRI